MIEKDETDFYYWPLEFSYANFTENNNVKVSKTTSINAFNFGQVLRKPNKFNQSDFSLFFIENIRLLIFILVGFISTVTAKFTLLKLIKQRCNLSNLLSIHGFRLDPIPTKIGFIALAFSFFIFFNLNILTNMINTQKITVDTSEFIDSIPKLNKTTKTLITLYTDTMALFYRLFKKRKQNDDIIASDYTNFQDFFSRISKHGFDNHFYFMGEIYFMILIYYTTLLNTSLDPIIFFKPTIYFELLRSIFYRKNLDPKMKKILISR